MLLVCVLIGQIISILKVLRTNRNLLCKRSMKLAIHYSLFNFKNNLSLNVLAKLMHLLVCGISDYQSEPERTTSQWKSSTIFNYITVRVRTGLKST